MANKVNDYEIPLGHAELLRTNGVYEELDVAQSINTKKKSRSDIRSNTVRTLFEFLYIELEEIKPKDIKRNRAKGYLSY